MTKKKQQRKEDGRKAAPQASPTPMDMPTLLAEAETLLRVGDGAKAARIVDRVIAVEPHPRLFAFRGAARFVAGDYHGCIADSTHLLEVDRGNVTAWTNRANARNALRDTEGALSDYTQALAILPTDLENLRHRGALLTELGRLDEAMVDLNQVLARDPQDYMSIFHRGVVEHAKGNLDGAAEDWTRILSAGDAVSRVVRVKTVSRMATHAWEVGDFHAAADYNSQLVKLDPEEYLAHVKCAMALTRLGDLNGAVACYSTVLHRHPQVLADHDVNYHRGVLYHQLGDLDAALADYSASIAREPSVPMVHFGRSQIYARRCQYEKAISDITNAYNLDRKNTLLLCHRGKMQHEAGNYRAAINDFTEALAVRPDDVVLYTSRGLAYSADGQLEAALQDIDEALSRDHTAGRTMLLAHKANALSKLGRYAESYEWCTQTIAAQSATPGFDPAMTLPIQILRITAAIHMERWEDGLRDWDEANKSLPYDSIHPLRSELHRLKELLESRTPLE